MQTKQARFWIFTTAPVRIKLNPGQTLNWSQFRRTDEGWSSEALRFEYTPEGIVRQSVNDGRDCDGRLTHYDEAICPLDALTTGNEFEGVIYPKWQDLSHEQRDEYAEAMNY